MRMQEASLDIWDKKYRLKAQDGTPVDKNIEASYMRVAIALAAVEKEEVRLEWEQKFFEAMLKGAIPAGRIMSNAGAGAYKPNTSMINCVVSGTLDDSMVGILDGVKEGGISLAAGCGIGYDFSTLRPKGAFVAGVGAYTSGAVSFMDIYDRMCFCIASAGGRRGAQMGTLDVSHPDLIAFIEAKRQDGRLRQFNLSVLVTDEFMRVLKDDGVWKFSFPLNHKEKWEGETIVRDSKVHKVYSEMPAKTLWDLMMKSTYNFAEPGVLFIDRINHQNPLYFCESIRATNPCGEQPLPPYGSCLLGSINLTKFVNNPFTSEAEFDYAEYIKVVRVFTRMLDNVVELNGLPLPQQREEIKNKRRHGMGFTGLGSALAMLRVRYGSKGAQDIASNIAFYLAQAGLLMGVELAKEKGPCPVLAGSASARSYYVNGAYISNLCQTTSGLQEGLLDYGCRFTHHSSIAPTGTISLSLGNNCSNGIEPSFSHEYTRNVIREGLNAKEAVTVCSYEYLLYKELINPDATPDTLPDYFATANNITPAEHVAMQAAVQPWIDSAISKTVNIPSEMPFEDFKDVYVDGYNKGLKGLATFRFVPENFQGVLVNDSDLEKTTYEFTLDSGEVVTVKGNDEIEYKGQTQSAANLYDAIKEGYFGRLG